MEAVAALPLASLDPSDQVRGAPADAVSQVDQFLREALEKPRERLASKFFLLGSLRVSLALELRFMQMSFNYNFVSQFG